MNFILGTKIRMTQIFQEDGRLIPVTEISVKPSTVIGFRTKEKDGYSALILAYGFKRKVGKSILGFFKGLGNFRTIKEFRTDGMNIDLKVGDKVGLNSFNIGDKVKVSSLSKGRGFQGVVKRHKFAGAIQTHGTKDQVRMPGSIGATAPARVFKGLRMPGHMGTERVTTDNLVIIKIDSEKNLLYVKGAVSGARNALLYIYGNNDYKLFEEVKTETTIKEEEIIEEPKVEVKKEDINIESVATSEEVKEVVVPEEKVEEIKEEVKTEETKEVKEDVKTETSGVEKVKEEVKTEEIKEEK